MSESMISFIVHYGPTLLFLLMLLVGFLLGLIRGFRKSLILLIQSLVLFTIFLIIFLIIAPKESTDISLFNLVNKILKGDTALQTMLGVSENCSSFKECFIEFIPKQVGNPTDGMYLILKDNGQYLATLSEAAVRLVIALILWLVYLVAIFIMYIVYLIFYSQGKHIKKLKKEYYSSIETKETSIDDANSEEAMDSDIASEESSDSDTELEEAIDSDTDKEEPKEEVDEKEEPKNKPDFVYNKRKLFGALVGTGRSLIKGIIMLSFVGSFFYIVAGGSGTTKSEKVDWNDNTMNLAYSAYSEIGSYGTSGIYKVLNAFKDKENTPYYLFAADLVFQGGLEDIERNVNANIYLRNELGTYVGFARQTFDLLLKYGSDDIRNCIVNKTDNTMDVILGVMAKDGFQEEYREIIASFKASTYFVNLTYSFITSFINHIDSFNLESSIGAVPVGIIKLLFQKEYYCLDIPYEKYLSDTNSKDVMPTITPEFVLNNQNILAIYDILMEYVAISQEKMDDQTKMIVSMISNILPHLKDLTLFDLNQVDTMNPVLSRLYVYLENTLLKGDEATSLTSLPGLSEIENPYTSDKYKDINWVSELRSVVDVASDALTIYSDVYQKDAEVIDVIFNIFDDSNPNKERNSQLYDNITDSIGNSFLLGDVLASGYGKGLIKSAISSVAPDAYLVDISYSNNGSDKGEFYYLLTALKQIAATPENRETFNSLMKLDMNDTKSLLNTIEGVADAMLKDTEYGSVLDSILSSKLFSSVLSEVLIQLDLGDGVKIYISNDMLLSDGNGNLIHRINRTDLESFFENASDMLSLIKDLDFSGELKAEDLISKVLSEKMYNTLDSKIIEGTASNLVIQKLTSDLIKLPTDFKNGDFISTSTKDSEIKKLIGLYKVKNLDMQVFVKEYANSDLQRDAIVDMLGKLTDEDFNNTLDSNIIYYSISGYLTDHADGLLGDTSLYLPAEVMNTSTGDPVVPELILKNDLVTFLKSAPDLLDLVKDVDMSDQSALVNAVLCETMYNTLESKIIEGTASNLVVKKLNSDMVKIPTDLKNGAYLSTEEEPSEVKKLIGLYQIENLDVKVLVKDYNGDSNAQRDAIVDMLDKLTDEEYEETFNSNIIYYSISGYLTEHAAGLIGDSDLYIPQEALVTSEIDPVVDKLITKEDLTVFLQNAKDLLDLVKDLDMNDKETLIDTVISEEMYNTLVSKIVEATTSDLIVKKLATDMVKLPTPMTNGAYLSTATEESEAKKLIGLYQVEHLDLKVLVRDYNGDSNLQRDTIINNLDTLTTKEYEDTFKSNIIYYSISGYLTDHAAGLIGDSDLYIPQVALVAGEIDSVLDKLITKEDLTVFLQNAKDLLDLVKDLDMNDKETLIDTVISEEMYNTLVSKIVEATTSDLIVKKLASDMVKLPSTMKVEDGYVSTATIDSEAKKLIGLYQVEHLDLKVLVRDYSGDSDLQRDTIIDNLDTLTTEEYNDTFESNIIYFSMSQYLIDKSVGMLGTGDLYIHEDTKTTETGDTAITSLIKKNDLIQFLKNAKALLDKVKTVDMSNKEELVNAVINEDVYNTLVSKIIEGTISDVISTKLNSGLVVLPDALVAKEGYLSTAAKDSEAKKLIGLYQVDNFKLSVLVKDYADNATQLNAIIGMLKDCTKADYDDVFESKIMYYSMSKYMTDNHATMLNDDTEVVLPNVVKTSSTESQVPTLIIIDELTDLLVNLCIIAPNDLSNMDFGVLTNTIIKNDSVLDNICISATMTNILNNENKIDAVGDSLIIPTSYATAGSSSNLPAYTKTNMWYAELPNMMHGLDALLGLSKPGNTTNLTDPGISTTLYTSFKDLNTCDYKGATRLEVAYQSAILASSITKRVDEIGVLNASKQEDVKETVSYGVIYIEEELASLIDAVNILNLDLAASSGILDTAMSNINNVLAIRTGTQTNLEYLYLHKMFGLVLTEGIEKSSTTIPTDAFVVDEKYITLHEANGLISSLDGLGVDLNTFEIDDSMSITKLLANVFEINEDGTYKSTKTLVALQAISEELLGNADVYIPISEYNSTLNRIKDKSIYDFFISIQVLGVATLAADISGTAIPDTTDTAVMNKLTASIIFNATLSQSLEMDVNGSSWNVALENNAAKVSTTTTASGSSIAVLSAEEIKCLLHAFKTIAGGSTTNISIDTAKLKALKASGDMSALYASSIIVVLLNDMMIDAYKLYPLHTTINTTEIIHVDTLVVNSSYELMTTEQMDSFILLIP